MSNLLKRLADKKMSRRTFLQGSAAAVAALALTGCSQPGSELEETKTTEGVQDTTAEMTIEHSPIVDPDAAGGEWITAACWHNCGGRCMNKVLINDGIVIRQKTDDVYQDTEDGAHFQNRSCLRGRAQQQQCFGADRLKYPMKRKNWQPGGGENSQGQLRGVDEWERISWEEAIDYAASEIKRIYENYGPTSAFLSKYTMGAFHNIMATMGGYVYGDSTESYGTWKLCSAGLGLTYAEDHPSTQSANDRFDLVNAETIIFYGGNPAWASNGTSSWFFAKAKEAGVKFAYVGPSYNISANMFDAKWIRVRPGTDTAFLLAVVYEMLRLDPEEKLIDWDFLHTYCVGFDAESMPADAKLDENFQAYVLGEYDNLPKTPEWATEICGTPVEDITWFAREMTKQKKVMLLHSYAAGRCNGAENLPQLIMTVGAMGGHMGKSGHSCGLAYHYEAGNCGPRLIKLGSTKTAYPMNPLMMNGCVPGCVAWKGVVDGQYQSCGMSGNHANYLMPASEQMTDIRLICSQQNNFLQSRMDVNMGIKAFRKAEFVLAVDYKLTLTCQYADIVLPAPTKWEGYASDTFGITSHWINRETMVYPRAVVEKPLFESKSDQEIGVMLAEKLGLDVAALFPVLDEKQQYFDYVAGSQVIVSGKPDSAEAVWENLVKVTQEDMDEFGVTGEPHDGRVPFKELLEQGIYHVECKEDGDFRYICYEDFIKDPVANPRPSKSGKFEIYCQTKADSLNAVGINPEPIKPYPNYIKPYKGYEESFEDWDAKKKGKYPFQMYTPHYLRRSHTTLDNLPWLQEAFENPIFVNADDAKAKGIKTGDTVLVFNEYGKVLRHASVLETIMPGCVALPHGVRSDVDDATGIDKGGSENTLIGSVRSNYFPQLSGYNTCLVDFEKYDGDPIPHDYEKVFAVDFD